MDLPEQVIPAQNNEAGLLANFDLNLESLVEKATQNHPEINAYRLKLDALGIEKKLKFQQKKLKFQELEKFLKQVENKN